jgi:hypothetical protein
MTAQKRHLPKTIAFTEECHYRLMSPFIQIDLHEPTFDYIKVRSRDALTDDSRPRRELPPSHGGGSIPHDRQTKGLKGHDTLKKPNFVRHKVRQVLTNRHGTTPMVVRSLYYPASVINMDRMNGVILIQRRILGKHFLDPWCAVDP